MTPLRAVLILCGAMMLSACGSSSQGSEPGDTQHAAKSPAIEAIDEPAEVLDYASLVQGTNLPRRYLKELIRTYQPAEGAEPRAIARLRLSAGDSSYARLVAWRNVRGKLCVQTELEDVTSSPGGPCYAGDPCRKLCLELTDRGDDETLYVLSGIIDSRADGLRITFDDGRVVTYELAGPVLPGSPEYRVFMLDLGRDLDQRLELLRDDETIAEQKRPPAEIKGMRCDEDYPPALPTQDSQRRESQHDECLERAGSQ